MDTKPGLWRVIGALVLLAMAFSGRDVLAQPAIGSLENHDIDWFNGGSTTWGEFSFELISTDPQLHYLNVFDGSQPIAATGWQVYNLPITPDLDVGRRYATVFDAGTAGSTQFEVWLTTTPLSTPPLAGSGTSMTGPYGPPLIYDGSDLNGRPGGPPSTDPLLLGLPPQNGPTLDLFTGFGVWNYHRNVPDETQGRDECGPTSAANSFAWLNDHYDGDKLYDLDLPADKDEASEIRDILKDAAHMKTLHIEGTTDGNMIRGKLKFIEENDLPLQVEFQDNSLGDITEGNLTATSEGNQPDFDWIFEQLEKGQDVELGMTWNGGKGGHWVTLVGAYYEDLQPGKGARGLWYNDPDDGETKTKFSWLGTSEAGEPFPGFLELESEANNSIDIVVAESPYESVWIDLLNALPGSLGEMILTARGYLVAFTQLQMELQNALANQLSQLVIGFNNLSATFKGGVLVPSPDVLLAIPTGPTGSWLLPTVWPPGIPPGLDLYFQVWQIDPGGPLGFAASNALRGTSH